MKSDPSIRHSGDTYGYGMMELLSDLSDLAATTNRLSLILQYIFSKLRDGGAGCHTAACMHGTAH
jgi:hypothetical protein